MKNLKKVLALALALVMLLGIMVTASASLDAYSDAEKITYDEAVDTLTGLGIMNGMTATTFDPQGDLTREQAAKLITYLAVGSTAAEALKAVAAPFDDVAANRWSSGYIAYCKQEGIINGVGDNNFDPTAKVTGLQLAKMLLCAVGYGEKGEYTGEKWAINVAKDALKNDLFKGNLAGANSTPATREEAALYVFNTLGVTCVTYSSLLDDYTTGGALGLGVASTIGDDVFKLTKDTTAISNGIAGHVWKVNGKAVSGFYADDTLLATSTNGTSVLNLTTRGAAGFAAEADAAVEVWLNGVKLANIATGGTTVANQIYYNTTLKNVVVAAATTAAANDPAYSKVGATVKLYDGTDDGAKADKVVIVAKTVVTLTADAVVSAATGYVTVAGIVSGADPKTVVGYEGLKKGDVVLYVTIDGITTIEKAEKVNGTLTAITNAPLKVFTIAGKGYSVSTLPGASAVDPSDFTTAMDYYLDDNGYICKISGVAATVATNYGVVLAYGWQASNVFTGATASSKIQIVNAAGTTEILDVIDPTTGLAKDLTADSYAAGDLIAYTLNGAGAIVTINKTVSTDSDGLTITNKASSITGITGTNYVTSKTAFFFYDSTNVAKPVTVYAGYAAVPTTTVTNGTNVKYIKNASNVVNAVLVPMAATTASETVFIVNNAYTATVVNGTTKYTFNGYINGALTTIDCASTNDSAMSAINTGAYTYVTNASTGLSTLTPVTTNTTEVTMAEADYFVAGTTYTVAPTSKVYLVTYDALGNVTAVTASAMQASDAVLGTTANLIALKASGSVVDIAYFKVA